MRCFLSSLILIVRLSQCRPIHFRWRAALFESLSPLSASACEDLFRVISEDTSSRWIENNFLKWKAKASHSHYSVVTVLVSYLIYITLYIYLLYSISFYVPQNKDDQGFVDVIERQWHRHVTFLQGFFTPTLLPSLLIEAWCCFVAYYLR